MMHIHILKTDIRKERVLKNLEFWLNSDSRVDSWSVDMEDIDRVLRIKSSTLSYDETILYLKNLEIKAKDLDPLIVF